MYLIEVFYVNFKEMSISLLFWLLMFFLILLVGVIFDCVLGLGCLKFVVRGVIVIVGFIVFVVLIIFVVCIGNLYVSIFWLLLGFGGIGILMGMSWVVVIDLGCNFFGIVLGWMNLWGNIGVLISLLLVGLFVEYLGWIMIF